MNSIYRLRHQAHFRSTILLKNATLITLMVFLSVNSLCSQIRRNLNDLSPASRTELVNLMKEYITKDVIENHCSSTSDGHTMDIHNDDNFLPFHRCYIEAMEDFLIKKGHPEYVPLPSWPPNTPVPTEFRTVDPDCSSAVCDIGVSGSTSTNCSSNINWSPNIARPGYLSLPIKTGANNDLCDFIVEGNAQNSITRIIEGQYQNVVNSNYHNSVHGTMGGAMSYFTSPALPLFWCFHAYVDDIWKEFQCSCPNKGGKALDLYMKDSPRVTAVTRDGGNEPNTDPGSMTISPDIWVRNQNDGKTISTSQNPIYSTVNYVYVRVRNRGCQTSSGNEQLVLHWSKAATDQTWPSYWNGSLSTPTLMGDIISTVNIPSIVAGGSVILEIQWFPPNSANYSSNTTPKLFSLLARIVSNDDPMATAEGSNITTNVKNNNNIVMKNVTIDSPPNVLPLVSINNPVAGAQFIAPASVTITANASDNDGSISKVEFYEGANLLGTVTTSPYSYNWTNVSAGTYTLTAKAYDDLNASTTSSQVSITVKNNTLPVVNISSPVDGAVYIGPLDISLTAIASDADGNISKVEFYNGNTLLTSITNAPYTYNWNNVPVGLYTLTAKAYDDLNAVSTSTPVIITVNNNNPPTVSIIAPTDGTTLIAPATITIKANAADSDGSISKVEFYNGTTLLGTSTSSPYSFDLNNAPAGIYTLTAKAYDNLNAMQTSDVVTLTVNNNTLPSVTI
ncbi:MAG TPA: Ig-like domain-containing protein, partial [Bacteroidia bacterium]|nr:Ig-like domain-containing protein [Bacteroidia bacterium]